MQEDKILRWDMRGDKIRLDKIFIDIGSSAF